MQVLICASKNSSWRILCPLCLSLLPHPWPSPDSCGLLLRSPVRSGLCRAGLVQLAGCRATWRSQRRDWWTMSRELAEDTALVQGMVSEDAFHRRPIGGGAQGFSHLRWHLPETSCQARGLSFTRQCQPAPATGGECRSGAAVARSPCAL